MANRTLQAKALKLKRQLRKMPHRMPEDVPGEFIPHNDAKSVPKRLLAGAVQVPRQPNRELMDGYKHRAKSLSMADVVGRFAGIPPGRLEAIQRAMEMQKDDVDPSIAKLLRYIKCRLK